MKVYKIVRRQLGGGLVSYTAEGSYKTNYTENITTRRANIFVFEELAQAQEEIKRPKHVPLFEIWECETPETRPAPKIIPMPEYTDPGCALYNPTLVRQFWERGVLTSHVNMTSEGALLCDELTLIQCVLEGA